MTRQKTARLAIATVLTTSAVMMATPFALAQLDDQLAGQGPTVLEPSAAPQTIYETDSVAQAASSEPDYREYSDQSQSSTSGQSGYSTMDDGRRVIYGADGTIYVEDQRGSGTYSSLGVDSPAVSQPTPSSTVDYNYAPSVATSPNAVTQSGYPTSVETVPIDPAVAPYDDPYASEAVNQNYGVRGQAAPGAGTGVSSPTTYPTTQKAVQSANYLDWAKRHDGTRLSGTAKSIRRLIEDSSDVVAHFIGDENYEPLWRLSRDAKAIVIVPRLYRGGFVFGGSGGNAILMARQEAGGWSEPAFYTIGSASFGLQAGGDVSEVILLIMTDRGKEQFLSSSFKVGGDVGIAAGPYGIGGKAQLTDVIAYTQSKGLYGGISLEGAVIKARYEWNDLYYGRDVSTSDILIRNQAHNPNSSAVKLSVARLQSQQLNNAPVEQR